MPGCIVQPQLFGLRKKQDIAVIEHQADARKVLSDAQSIHGLEHMHLRDAGAEAIGGDVAVVHVGAQLRMAKRQQQRTDQLDILC
ncbi:hypothetical protein D3C84_1029480 [compost metagenome]